MKGGGPQGQYRAMQQARGPSSALLTSTPMEESGFHSKCKGCWSGIIWLKFSKTLDMETRPVRRLFLGEKEFQIPHLQN